MSNSAGISSALSSESVPVVDFGPYLNAQAGAFEDTVAAVGQACTHLGFFFIKNHGVPQLLIDRMFRETERFHALPLGRKLDVKALQPALGYLPLGGQTQRTYASLYGESKHPDRSASFYIRREYLENDLDRISGKPWVCDNRWPQGLPGFRETAIDYFDAMTRVARRILVLHAVALGMPPDYLTEHDAFRTGDHTLRLLNYPAGDPALEGQFGIGPHSDYGYGSILAQAKLPGLEILTRANEWIQAPALDGHLLFNNGDMCQRWSNDEFRSAPHRVINRTGQVRHSIPFFVNPREDVRFACFASCYGPDRPAHYSPQSFGEAMAERRKNYNLPTGAS